LVDTNKDDKLDTEIAKRLDDLFGEGIAFSDKNGVLKADDPTADENKSPDTPPVAAPTAEEDEIVELEHTVANEEDAEPTSVDYPLSELKNMVLSIDWEITDEVLSGFLSQINNLKNIYKNDKIVLMFLQLLGSLGAYIKTYRGNAHPKTFKILNSVFSHLEDVVLSEDMEESEKKKLLRVEMNKYKQLRKQVAQKKAAQASRRQAKPIQKDKLRLSAPKKKKSVMHASEVPAAAEEEMPSADSIAAKSSGSMAEAVEELKQFIHAEISVLKQEIKILKKSR
jgi:hypothetical protein